MSAEVAVLLEALADKSLGFKGLGLGVQNFGSSIQLIKAVLSKSVGQLVFFGGICHLMKDKLSTSRGQETQRMGTTATIIPEDSSLVMVMTS